MSITRRLILIAFILVPFLSSSQQTPPNFLSVPDQEKTISFIWEGDSLANQWNPHAAILIPVTIQNCSGKFYMQFDLGSPYTLFYRKHLKEFSTRCPVAFTVSDTTSALHDFLFLAGGMKVLAKQVVVADFPGPITETKNSEKEIIGTLGADWIDNRIIAIDYPASEIRFYKSDKKINIPTSNLIYMGRRILLPSVIKGQQTTLYFDTGSSAFELLVSEEKAKHLSIPQAGTVRYPVNSWGKQLYANTTETADSIQLASTTLPIQHVTYIEGSSNGQVQQMMKLGIGGMTGNKLFIHRVLFLDLINKRFAVLPPGKLKQD